MTAERLFKVLGADRTAFHGGSGQWHARKWMPPIGGVELCVRGYHLCRQSDLLCWLGPEIWEATYRGERVDGSDKVVVSEARLIRQLPWNERTARLFAADCAESALQYADPATATVMEATIEAVRRFARGDATASDLSAAWSAARSAARSAAGSAAGSAARSAAWSAQQTKLMEYLYPGGM